MTEIITMFFSISLDVAKAGIPSRDGNGHFPHFGLAKRTLCVLTLYPQHHAYAYWFWISHTRKEFSLLNAMHKWQSGLLIPG